jgi:predicted permease
MAMQRVIEPGSDYLGERGDGRLSLIGRLKSGVTVSQAQSVLTTLANNLAQENPQANEGTRLELVPPGIHPQVRGGVIGFAGVMMLIVLLVLALACTNLANLLLARSTERRREIAIRLALGASRLRLVRQLVTESVMLSLVGGAVGLLLAVWMNDVAGAFKPPIDFSLVFELPLDARVLLYTLLLSFVSGIVFGLLPALQATKPDLVPALKAQASLGGFHRSRLRNALVAGQMALSLLLLICAGLMLRSLQQASTIHPGFEVERAVAMSFDVGLQGYDETRGREFYRQLTERVRALPEVESVTLTGFVPLSLNNSSTSVFGEGQSLPRGAPQPDDYYGIVNLDYFRTMRIPLVRGREFDPGERKGTQRVCIINEALERRLFPGESAIGKRVSFGDGDGPFTEVVGVAQDGKYVSLGEDSQTFIYFPLEQRYSNSVTLIARTRSDSLSVIPAIRRELQTLDPTLPIYEVKTLEEHLGLSLFPARAAGAMLGGFGLLALLLAALGIYGVMSYAVAGRTREIGVRMALGAQVSDVLRLILRQGMTLVVLGITLGLIAAFAATRLLSSLLYGVSASDPLTFAGVTILLATVALLACYIPARRATKVDPMVALRYE